ncbi:MAG TPA: hypothetical protein G4O02_07715 [Caldilineae bacterium]|nr:hypothetical protein [Caldilineae bacterium]
MKAALRMLSVILATAYSGGIILWLVLRVILPDSRLWCLAVANTFAEYLFLPLVPIILAAWMARSRWALATTAVPLAVFLWMFGPLFLPRLPPPRVEGRPLIIMTFNVWGFNRNAQAIASVIRQVDPDIVLLQEFRGWVVTDLAEELGDAYPYHDLPDAYLTKGSLGIFSRYPIVSAQRLLLPDVWRPILYTILEVDGQRIHVFNLHLISSSRVFRWGSSPRYIERTYERRELAATRLQKFIATLEGPIIVAGDLNTTPQTTTYRILTTDLKDAFYTVGWGFGHTYPARSRRIRRTLIPARLLRIDHILYSSHFEAVRAYVGPWDGISDHLPVVAELRLNQEVSP